MTQALEGKTPGVWRILAAMLYDALLVIGCIMVTGFIAVAANGFEAIAGHTWKSWGLTGAIILVWCGFYVYFWSRQGQTLGMRAWKLIVINQTGHPPGMYRSLLRWLLALILLAPAGFGLWWKYFDREQQTLYDRLCRTRLLQVSSNPYQKRKE